MSRILEAVLGWFLGVAAFFDNIKARRGDDELTARYKQLQRSCVWATVLPLGVTFAAFLAGNLLEALDVMFQHAQTLNGPRSTAFAVVMTAFAASTGYAVFSYWRLWRFCRDEGMV